MKAFSRAKRQAKLPTVQLAIGILYGSGLRRMELVRLRVNDINSDMKQIRIWNGKGFKHCFTTLAVELLPAIRRQTGLAIFISIQPFKS